MPPIINGYAHERLVINYQPYPRLFVNGTGIGSIRLYVNGADPVELAPAPVADFSSSYGGGPGELAPFDIFFDGTLSTGVIDAYIWERRANDGIWTHFLAAPDDMSSINETFTALVGTDAVYDVQLTVVGPGGYDTKTELDYVTVIRRFDVTLDPSVQTTTDVDTPLTLTVSWDIAIAADFTVDWGDGSPPYEALDADSPAGVPPHTYDTPGTYVAVVTVSNLSYSPGSASLQVAVTSVPVADFTSTPAAGETGPGDIFFDFDGTISTGLIDTYTWESRVNGGSWNAFQSSPTSPGMITEGFGSLTGTEAVWDVRLTVTGPGGSDTKTVNDYATVFQRVAVTTDPTGDVNTDTATPVTLTVTWDVAAPGDVYVDWGDGSPIDDVEGADSGVVVGPHTYDIPGSYPVYTEVAISGYTPGSTGMTFNVSAADMFESFLSAPPAPDRTDGSYCLGMRFTLSAPITVTAVGRCYQSGNSLDHTVTLWDTTPTKLAEAVVLAAATSDSLGFKWQNLDTPVVLSAGVEYRIAIDESGGAELWNNLYDPDLTAVFTELGSCYVTAVAGTYPVNANGTPPDNCYSSPAIRYH